MLLPLIYHREQNTDFDFHPGLLIYKAGLSASPSGETNEANVDENRLENRKKYLISQMKDISEVYNAINPTKRLGAIELSDPLDPTNLEKQVLYLQKELTAGGTAKIKLDQLTKTIALYKKLNKPEAPADENKKKPEITETEFKELVDMKNFYNSRVRTRKHIRTDSVKTEISASADTPDKILKEIGIILRVTDLTKREKNYLGKMKADINKLKKTVKKTTSAKKNEEGIEETDSDALRKAGKELYFFVEEVKEGLEKRDTWRTKKIYGILEDTFDNAVHGSRTDFDSLQHDKHGNIDKQRYEESLKLFMAMMEGYTDRFTKDPSIILKPVNFKDNIKRFPMLFNSWMEIKHPGLVEAIDSAERNIRPTSHTLADVMNRVKSFVSIDINFADPKQKEPQTQYWNLRKDNITHVINVLKQKAENADANSPSRGTLNSLAHELEEHVTHAAAQYSLAAKLIDREEIEKQFTRENMSKSENSRNFIEALMMQYQKTMEMVDDGVGYGTRMDEYNPAVRRLLIASIFERGVGGMGVDSHGNEYYDEDLGGHNEWMFETLSSSEYFNGMNDDSKLDTAQRLVLEVAYLGGRVADELEASKYTLTMIKQLLELQGKSEQKQAVIINNLMDRGYTREEIEEYTKEGSNLQKVYNEIINDNQKREKFLVMAHEIIQNPYTKGKNETLQPHKNLAKLDADGDGWIDNNTASITLLEQGELDWFQIRMGHIDRNYDMLKLEGDTKGKKSDAEVLELMGLDVTAIWTQYLLALEDNPDMHVSNWGDALAGDGNLPALVKFMDRILPKGSGQMAREEYLLVLASLDNPGEIDKQTKLHREAARKVTRMIRDHIENQEEVMGAKALALPDIMKKLDGWHMGDDIENGIRTVWNMAFGSGQSWANRAAGIIAIVAAVKLIRKGIKMEDAAGKGIALAGGGIALSLILKESIGLEIPELLGLNTLGEAAENTHEEALAQDGRESMEELGISKEEHLRALFALNDVPFNKIMAWYELSDKVGADYMTSKSTNLETTAFDKLGIDISNIIKGKMRDGNEVRARYIVRETVRQFFGYVAKKEDKSLIHTQKGMKERWILKIKNPKYPLQYSDTYFQEFIDKHKGHPEKITWKTVMEAEVLAYHVQETVEKNGLGPLFVAVEEWGYSANKWLDQGIFNNAEGYMEDFFQSLGETADETAIRLGNLAETAGLKLHFMKEGIKFWYNNHEWELRRMGEGVWGIFVAGVTLPVKAIYGGLNFAIPWTETKLRQLTELLRPDNEVSGANPNLGLTSNDIADLYLRDANGKIVMTGGMPQIATNPQDTPYELNTGGNIVMKNGKPVFSRDLKRNPQFKYFGHYQQAFMDAFSNHVNANSPSEGKKYYAEVDDIGYHIVEINHQTAGIGMNDPTFKNSPDNQYSRMLAVARDEAVKFYINKGVEKDLVEKYMYPIHTVTHGKPSPTITVFYRMPLADSAELIMKERGRWVDSMNPNVSKSREVISFDPKDTTWEKFRKISGVKYDKARRGLDFAGRVGVQGIYLWRKSWETLGYSAAGIYKFILPNNEAYKADAIESMFESEEATNQLFDEISSAAMYPGWSSSEFYKDKENANLYRLAREYSIANEQDIYLGFMRDGFALTPKGKKRLDEKDVPVEYKVLSNYDSFPPAGWSRTSFEEYYNNTWLTEGNPPCARLKTYLDKAKL